MNGKKIFIQKRYQLSYELIKSIFDNSDLLSKVLNAGSDFYTDRQRRLIFTQINKTKEYHYKKTTKTCEELDAEKLIDELFADSFE